MAEAWNVGTIVANSSSALTVPNYSNEFDQLKLAIENLTIALNGPDGLTINLKRSIGAENVTNSLASIAKATADNLKAINALMKDMDKKMTDQTGAGLQLISKQLSGIASTLNNGVATQYILTANTIKKNAFDQANTVAALQRNNITPVIPTNADFLTTMQGTIVDAGNIAAQASATGFITTQANRAITAATDYVGGLLPTPGEIFNNFKSLFPANSADTSGKTVQTEATILKNLSDTRYA